MIKFINIAANAFMELVRQPVFLLLLVFSASFGVILAAVPYFGFGDDPKMVKDTVLAATLLAGLFGAVITSSFSVSKEIRTGTALAVLSKPVGRFRFLAAKYVGLIGVLTVLTFANLLSALIASKTAYDAYGDADMVALGIYFGLLMLGFAVAGFTNFFLRRPFVADAVVLSVLMMTVAFVLIWMKGDVFSRDPFHEESTVDWRLLPAMVLLLFAFYVLAGVALVCATRLDVVASLSVCTAVFLLGLMSDYVFGRPASDGVWWASILYSAMPNWQLFWLADALGNEKSIPWSYVTKASGYVAAYVGALLCLAMVAFDDRELA